MAHADYIAYTNSTGEFRYTFQPLAGEAGGYTVEALVQFAGLQQSDVAQFDILGLWQQPATLSTDMSMNATQRVDLTLRNIGDIELTDLHYSVIDANPTDEITASVDSDGLPTRLAPGASVSIPVQIASPANDAPAQPAVFTVRSESAQGSIETTVVDVRLHEAVGLARVTPDPLMTWCSAR